MPASGKKCKFQHKGTIVHIASKKHDYLPALTGLRFVLAIWVVLHHLSGQRMMLESFTNSLPVWGQSLVHGGYLAVETFFILSGFVLARTYAHAEWKGRDLLHYGAARIARIYPVYLLSLLVVMPFIIEAMLKPTRTAAQKMNLLVDYGFVLQGWTGGLNVGWNTPAWTLSCEFFFYLLFPLLILAMRRARRPAIFAVLGICLVTPVILAHSNVPWTWKPIYHLSDFAAGIAGARIFGWLQPRMFRRGYYLYLPAVLAGTLLIIFPRLMDGTYGDVNTGLRPLNVLALIGFSLGGGTLARLLSSRVAEYLGKASYSMYILHVPLLWWYGQWATTGPLHLPGIVAALLYLAIVIAISTVVFERVEVPANRWVRSLVTAQIRRTEPVALRAAA
ncbi:MAG: acyltransferase [Terriglobia bacterium]